MAGFLIKGKTAEAGRNRNPRHIVSPCRVRIISFNYLDLARNTFELCPEHIAKKRNRLPILIFNFGGESEIRTRGPFKGTTV